MASDVYYTTKSVDGIVVVVFRQSQMVNAITLDQVGTNLKELIDGAEEDRFVLDFSQVEYLSSSALGMLIGLQRRVAQKKGQSGINDEIEEVFRITKLDTVFDIYKDAAAAVDTYRSSP